MHHGYGHTHVHTYIYAQRNTIQLQTRYMTSRYLSHRGRSPDHRTAGWPVFRRERDEKLTISKHSPNITELAPNAQYLTTKCTYHPSQSNDYLSWHFLICRKINISLWQQENSMTLLIFRTTISQSLSVTIGNWDFSFNTHTRWCMFTHAGTNTGCGNQLCI